MRFRKDYVLTQGWLGSWVVTVLDSGAEGPRFKSQSRRCRVTVLGKLFTPIVRASVHQAAKLVAALLKVAGVTAGLAESNGSLPPGLWLTSPAGWLPITEISSGTLRSVIEYGLPLPFYVLIYFFTYRSNTLWQCSRGFETLAVFHQSWSGRQWTVLTNIHYLKIVNTKRGLPFAWQWWMFSRVWRIARWLSPGSEVFACLIDISAMR